MRIYFDHQLFSLQDAGGATRYFYELVRHIQARNSVNIELALGLNSSVYPFLSLRNAETRVSAIRSNLSPGTCRLILNEILNLPSDILRSTVDIYHPTLYRASSAVRRRRMVVTHHDCTHERYPELFRHGHLVVENKRKLYQAADAILCVSESSRKDLLHFHKISEERTHVVHHGFRPFAVSDSGEDELHLVNASYILFVGTRSTYKNFDLLLQAYSISGLSSDYYLLAVGGGEFSPAELQTISGLNLTGLVRVIPKASEALLAQAYSRAAIFVYPSLYEGFGFPPLEAMGLGCPAVVSNSSSMPEICGDAALYFNPEDPLDLGGVLKSILADDGARSRMKDRGFRRIKLYDWNDTAAKTLQVYQDVINA